MMKHSLRGLVLLAVLVAEFPSAAVGQAAGTGKFLPIVFDDWWNVDYVKNGCQMAASEAQKGNPNAKACPATITPRDVVNEFEDQLQLAFATESACHGLQLLHLTPEMIETAAKNPAAPATGTMAKVAKDQMVELDA